MAYKINSNTVIDGSNTAITGTFIRGSGLTLKNDVGEIFIQDSSPMVGTVAGYSSGGFGPSYSNVIEKFPFTSDSNSADVGDLTIARQSPGGHSSAISGYTSGGRDAPTNYNVIDKFPFAINNNATDVGNLTFGKYAMAGTSSLTHGYTASGFPASSTTIQKFPFSSDSNATDIGALTQGRAFAGTVGQSSTTYGYHAGGYSGPPRVTLNTIDRFSFTSDGNATDVGDLTEGKEDPAAQSSTTHGYSSGGLVIPGPGHSNVINKFPFATNTNATDIGDLTVSRKGTAGHSSYVSGYSSGGEGPPTPPITVYNTIDKFPFATDSNASDVGDLTATKRSHAGQQD